jgi:putative ABC transport system permease protein
VISDLRYALRTLRSRPGFTAVAVVSLALGIGANTAIFSLVDGLWTRPLAVPHPAAIVRVFSVTSQEPEGAFSYPEYLALSANTSALRALAAVGARGAIVPSPDGTSELHTVNVVSANFFEVLGLKPLAGRLFGTADPDAVVVLGHSFWKRRYGGDLSIVGRQIELLRGAQSSLFTVVGVLPATFRALDNGADRDLWLPPQSWERLAGRGDFESRDFRWFRVIGRLTSGAPAASASAQAQAVALRLAADWPASNRGRGARVISDSQYRLQRAGSTGLLLLATVLLLVTLCSVNVANLLLARGAARNKEIAIRLSLGAGRLRLLRQLMTENLLLGLAGLGTGLALGAALIQLLPTLLVQPPAIQPVVDFQLDGRVLLFAVLVGTATIVLFGLSPAWSASKANLTPALKSETPSIIVRGRRLQACQWLVVTQVALSLALLAGTGVLGASFANTRTLDYGIAHKPLLLVWMNASGPQANALYREAVTQIRALPGVRRVSFASRAPLSLSEGGMAQRVTFPDVPERAGQPPIEIKFNSIGSDYLQMMGTAVRRGRPFDDRDQQGGEAVALISETMAQRFWPQEDALGKTIKLNSGVHRIVGIVQDVPINAIGEPAEPYLYLPYWRNPTSSMTFVIETAGNPMALAQPVRHKLISTSRLLDPFMLHTQQDLVSYAAGQYQVAAELVSTLSLLGLMLTAVGLYGIVSSAVTLRTREIGIRVALGADRRQVRALVLQEVTVLGISGIILGLPLALAGTRLASSTLFAVSPWDPRLLGLSVIVLALVLLAAGLLPARRATRVDPLVALKYE